jgi:hypothetical protein
VQRTRRKNTARVEELKKLKYFNLNFKNTSSDSKGSYTEGDVFHPEVFIKYLG